MSKHKDRLAQGRSNDYTKWQIVDRYVTDEGATLSVDTFGASAPGGVVLEKFGFTTDNIVAKAKELLG